MNVAVLLMIDAPAGSTAALTHGIDLVRVILSLALCLALGIGLAFLAKRTQRFRMAAAHRELTVLESTRLDTRTSLHIVRYGDQHMLVATTAGAITITSVAAPAGEKAS